MNHLDLFSGIGGFALAARWAGINTIAFCEIDSFCQKVLNKNFPHVPIYIDVKQLKNFGHVDLITAGFPCQPFSCAGSRKGEKDDRYLWPEVIRVIRETKPTWILLENVPGIIPMLDPILEELEKESYDWRAYLIPANSLGAPHKRERIWIVALADGKYCEQRTTNNKTEPERSKWSITSTETREIISDTYMQPDKQNDTNIQSNKETRETGYGRRGDDQPFFNWEENKPPVCGMDDGLPDGVDRNKSLGNAIVPQIVFLLMTMILTMEKKFI